MEGRALVAKAVLAGGELTEVARGLGHNVVTELEDDAAGGLATNGDVELCAESASDGFWRPSLRGQRGKSASQAAVETRHLRRR